MTALSLRQIVANALAEVGASNVFYLRPKGKARTTTWLGVEHGFGIRHYLTGRNVYIVQTRMRGRQAKIPNVRLHDLRHIFASHAAMNKETLPMIGRLLGHINPHSTARYAHLDDEHVLDAAEQIGAAIDRMMLN